MIINKLFLQIISSYITALGLFSSTYNIYAYKFSQFEIPLYGSHKIDFMKNIVPYKNIGNVHSYRAALLLSLCVLFN